MKIGFLVTAAAMLMGGTAIAQVGTLDATGTAAGGVSTATQHGATSGGLTAGQSMRATRDERRAERRARQAQGRDNRADREAAASSSTYGSGAIHTRRDRASAGVNSGGSATGTGSARSGSTVDAYGETTRDGSSADIYGDTQAEATNRPPNP